MISVILSRIVMWV